MGFCNITSSVTPVVFQNYKSISVLQRTRSLHKQMMTQWSDKQPRSDNEHVHFEHQMYTERFYMCWDMQHEVCIQCIREMLCANVQQTSNLWL